MKKTQKHAHLLSLLVGGALLTPHIANAQLTQIAPTKLQAPLTFVTFDNYEKGQLYAFSYCFGQAYASADNGNKWRQIINFDDYYDGTGIINTIRNFVKGKNPDVIYLHQHSNTPEGQGVFAVNSKTGEIKQYKIPDTGYDDSWVNSFDVYDSEGKIMIVDVNFRINLTTIYSTVFLTKDGGETYKEIHHNWLDDYAYPGKVAFHPTNPHRLYIFRGNGPSGVNGGVLISDDEGDTWHETLPGYSLESYAFNPKNPDEIYVGTTMLAVHEGLFHSTDGGETWENINLPWDNFIMNNIIGIAFDPNNPNNVIVMEENQVFASTDNFATYIDVTPPEYMWGTTLSVNPFNPDDIVMGIDTSGLIRSTDHLQSTRNMDYTVDSNCLDIVVSGNNIYYLKNGKCTQLGGESVEAEGYTRIFADATDNNSILAYNPETGSLDRFTFGDSPETAVMLSNVSNLTDLTYVNDRYILLIDSKAYSSTLKAGLTDLGLNNVTAIASTDKELFIAHDNTISVSYNSGSTWTNISSTLNARQIKHVAANSNGLIVADTETGIYKTTDNGRIWVRILDNETYDFLAVSPTDTDMIFVSANNSPLPTTISYTIDGGSSWKIITEKDLEYSHVSRIIPVFGSDKEDFELYLASSDMGALKYSIDPNPAIDEPVLPGNTDARNLTASINADGSCTLNWTSPEGHYEAIYNLYRDGVKIVYNTRQRTYTDHALTVGNHSYTIKTVYDGTETDGITVSTDYSGVKSPINNLSVTTDNLINGIAVVNISWNMPQGYDTGVFNIYRDNVLIAKEQSPTSFQDRNLAAGHYNYSVTAVYQGGIESKPISASADVINDCAPVRNLKSEFDIQERTVNLTWNTPGDLPDGWISNCGEPTGAYGPTEMDQYYTFIATRWSAQELQEMGLVGSSISAVTFVPTSTRAHYTAYVYIGDSETVSSDQYSFGLLSGPDAAIGEWNVLTGSPVEISEGKELWIILQVVYAGGISPIGVDSQALIPGRNKVAYKFNTDWLNLEDIDNTANFNFCLGARVQSPDGKMAIINRKKAAENNITYEISRDGQLIASTTSTDFSEGNLDEQSYTYSVKAIHGDKGSSPEMTTTIYAGNRCPMPSDATVSDETGNVVINWQASAPQLIPNLIFEEAFDGETIPEKWLTKDNDGDGVNFEIMHWSENGFLISNIDHYTEDGKYQALSPDNWVVSPKINITGINARAEFYVSSAGIFDNETYYEVLVSTTGTEYDDFTPVIQETLTLQSTIWIKKIIDLSAYSGDIYLAFRHKNTAGQNAIALYIDNLTVTQEVEQPRSYNIYRNGQLIATNVEGTTFTDENCPSGEHDWIVTTVCDEFGCESDPLIISLEVADNKTVRFDKNDIAIYYNSPNHAIVAYPRDGSNPVNVYDAFGRIIDSASSIDGSRTVLYTYGYTPGIYIATCGTKSVKIVIE